MIGILIYTSKEKKARIARDMGCALKISVFIASSPWNLAKDLQGRYAAPFLHTASDQKLEVGVRPGNKACVIGV